MRSPIHPDPIHPELSRPDVTDEQEPDVPPDAADPSPAPDPIEVDARGKPCPIPVIELATAVAAAELGTHVLLLADDPAAEVDVPVWCRMQRQALRSQSHDGAAWRFDVEKVRQTR